MMRSVFLFIFLSNMADCQQFRSDYNYHYESNGWLKLHRIPATFHDAWLRCDLEGAVLASPSNVFIESAIRKEMKNCNVATSGILTGIHATFSKGDFFSIEGIPLRNMPVEWMPVEPDNKNNEEDCVLYIANGTIADITCSELHPYICYKENNKNVVVNGCGTVDREYNLDTRTGKCYKFHKVARNWTRAFMTCAAEGGHLAIINSETEAAVLQELFARHPQNTIKSNLRPIMRDIIHVGFHDWAERGIWTTIHGQSLVEAGFDLWSENQPDNAGPGEYCGGMFRHGRLDDVWCNERGPFVCEKRPESLQEEPDIYKELLGKE
ncbi:uncharacterized protein LOC116775585 [Danaus plexippus]|uniref:uncharacterized protein LOC116775585 n=1 Tax=Danaus plexippus TaxID=13037 RepID=UPI002AB2E3C3|nr:uncharacterized protein LOC116775585 [Danaus plexippus]